MPTKRSARSPARSTTKRSTGNGRRPAATKAAARGGSRGTATKSAPSAQAAKPGKPSARKDVTVRDRRLDEPGATRPTLTPYLAVPDAARAIEWYGKAFGAREVNRMPGPGGKVMHAELRLGDSLLYLSDVFPGSDVHEPGELGGTSVNLHIHHEDIDRLWQRATGAGARVTMPLANQFWGDRYGKLVDPFGHSWAMSWPAKMTAAERKRLEQEAMRNMAMAGGPDAN